MILLFPELLKLIQLFLTIPVTSCTAECSFSSLRRLKTYLRSVTTQKRLNHVAILHCHRDQTSILNLQELCNNFISRNEINVNVCFILSCQHMSQLSQQKIVILILAILLRIFSTLHQTYGTI